VDLLEHERVVATLLGGLHGPLDRLDHPLDRPPRDVGHDDPIGREVGDVALLEEDHAAGVAEDRGHVRGEEGFALPDAHDEGHVLARADEPVVLVAVHDREGVRALELAQGGARGVGDVALVRLLDQVRDGLGVGLRGEGVPPGLQPVAERLEVLDDPVVDHGDPARAVDLRMGVHVVRPAVRGPARMGEPDRRVGRAVRDGGAQVAQLAGALLDEEVALVVDEGDAGGVIAAVLEAAEALHEDRPGLPRPRVSDDSTH
jgi:hypothetical protein